MSLAGLENIFLEIFSASRDAGILALAIGGLLLFAGRKITPHWRHLLWMLVALRLMLPVLPESPSSWKSWMPGSSPLAREIAVPFESALPIAMPPQIDNVQAVRETASSPVPLIPEVVPPQRSGQSILAIMWLAGVMGFLFLLSICTIRFRRKLRRMSFPKHEKLPEIRSLLEEVCREADIQRSPRLRITDAVSSPALTGLLRPEILIPPSAIDQLEMSELRLVLLHELGHEQRRDVWTSWLLSLLHVVHWFNPIVWWAFHRTRNESERATDAWVLQKTGANRAADYGEALLRLLEGSTKTKMPLPNVVGVLESPRDLKMRISLIAAFTGKRRRMAIVGAFVLFVTIAAVGLTQAPKELQEEDEFVINVQLVDPSGNPVPNPKVEVFSVIGWPSVDTITESQGDENGVVRMKVIARAGQIAFQAQSQNDELIGGRYAYPAKWTKKTPEEQLNEKPARLNMVRARETQLRFIRPDGEPVRGLKISVFSYNYGTDSQDRNYTWSSAKTDSEGRCTVSAAEAHRLIVQHDRIDLTNIDVKNGAAILPPDGEETEFILKDAHTLTGKVTLPDGTPIEGASLSNSGLGSSSSSGVTNEKGIYQVHHLEAANHHFTPRMPDGYGEEWVMEHQEVIVSSDRPTTVHNFSPKKGGILNVRFIDSITEKEIGVVAHPGIDTNSTTYHVGRLKVPEGYHEPKGNDVEFSFGNKSEVTINAKIKPITSEDTVKGRVVDSEGNPITGAKVIITPKLFNDPILTDEKGEFSHFFSDRVFGLWKHATIYAKLRDLSSDKFEWPRGSKEPVLITLEKPEIGNISGRVTDEEGKAVEGAEILLWSTDFNKYRTTVLTDSNGHYEFDEVRPGCELVVDAKHPSYGTHDYRGKPKNGKWTALQIRGGESVKIRDIKLPIANKAITGRVVDAEGNPVFNACLVCFHTWRQPRRTIFTAEDGSFTMPGLIGGWIRFELRQPDPKNKTLWRSYIFRAGTKNVELVFPEKGKSRFLSVDGIDFTGKNAPPLVVERWTNTTSPPSLDHGKKTRFFAFIALNRPTSYVSNTIKRIQKAQDEHPEIEFIFVHGNSPKEQIDEALEVLEKDKKITIPFAIEPFFGSLSETIQWSRQGFLILDETGIVVHQSKKLADSMKFLDTL